MRWSEAGYLSQFVLAREEPEPFDAEAAVKAVYEDMAANA